MTKTLCFWTPGHIGDIYLASFFIKCVCDQNPDITFLYYTINADVFFTGINNLKLIQEIDSCPIDRNYTCEFENGESPEDRSDRKWLDFLLNNVGHNTHLAEMSINNTDYTFLNTWCVPMGHDDFDFQSAPTGWTNTFNLLNDKYGYNFNFNFEDVKSIVNNTLIPRPDIKENVQEFFAQNKPNYKKSVFCYNFVPRSLPFHRPTMDKYLNFISDNNNLLVLANHDDMLCSQDNVISCDKDLGIQKVQSCENLLDLWNVAKCCDDIITLPTGSSWLFFHNLSELKGKKLYLLGNHAYAPKINRNIQLLTDDTDMPRMKVL